MRGGDSPTRSSRCFWWPAHLPCFAFRHVLTPVGAVELPRQYSLAFRTRSDTVCGKRLDQITLIEGQDVGATPETGPRSGWHYKHVSRLRSPALGLPRRQSRP